MNTNVTTNIGTKLLQDKLNDVAVAIASGLSNNLRLMVKKR